MPDLLRQRDFISDHLGRGLLPPGDAIPPVALAFAVLDIAGSPSVVDRVGYPVGTAIAGTPAAATPVIRDLVDGWHESGSRAWLWTQVQASGATPWAAVAPAEAPNGRLFQ